ncbi:MAG: ACT domain-containing protein [Pseudomonadota bacterium]
MSTAGERDLAQLLKHLSPTLAAKPFRIVAALNPTPGELDSAFMICREAEGTTLIYADESADADDAECYARITLQVHSSLAAVGLTAAVSAALMRESIPANVVAGFYHDHVFVPWAVRDRALETLKSLSDQSAVSF